MLADAMVEVPAAAGAEALGDTLRGTGSTAGLPADRPAASCAAPEPCPAPPAFSGEDAATPLPAADAPVSCAPEDVMGDESLVSRGQEEGEDAGGAGEPSGGSLGSRERLPTQRITLEMLSRGGFYDMPMAKAAHILGRTEGSFQRVCRGLGILRWPYRVRKSLQAIMAKTEEYLDDSAEEDGMSKAEVLRTLQARMDDIKGISGNGMDKATKQYRQYIFKLNHKLARRAAKGGDAPEEAPDAGALKAKGILRAASRIQAQKEEASGSGSSGQGSGDVARPRPRHARDLPGGGLALPGMAPAGAPAQPRRTATAEEYQKACLADNLELIRLCGEMDKHLAAAQEALSMRGPAFPAGLPPALAASLFLQQGALAALPTALAGLPAGLAGLQGALAGLPASLVPGALAGLPGGLAGLPGAAQLPGLMAPPPFGWGSAAAQQQQQQPPGSAPGPGFWPTS